jgi:hypothetical protein
MQTPSVFDPEAFRDPDRRFRPLQIIHGMDHHYVDGEPRLKSFLQKLVSQGTGGIVTNVSFTDYLTSPRQWDILREGIRKAADLGLRVWLYDEKGYPSGTAGGYVTRANPNFCALGLACYTLEAAAGESLCFPMPVSCRVFVWAGAIRSTAQAVKADFIDLTDQVDAWQTLRWDPPDGSWTVLYLAERLMYEGTHASQNVSDFKFYINTLDPAAVREFIRVTHEAYARELTPELWQHIDAIFTDEPSLMTQYLPELPERFHGKIDVVDSPVFNDRPPAVPWVNGFLERFREIKGRDLAPLLYALFYSESKEACCARQDYYEVVTSLYAGAFFEQIQDWCKAHGIESSGHVLLEEGILDHAGFEGSLMAVLRRLDLPGLDMLNSDPRDMIQRGSFMGDSFMAAKQAASAAHLSGRQRVHSESSDWEQRNQGRFASLDERRGQANLQFVLGVNLITSYFGWEELGEDCRRQYNDTVGRLSALLTGGSHICDVGILYPIRTVWAHYLPSLEAPKTWADRTVRSAWADQVNQTYPALVKELLTHQVDADIIDEEFICAASIHNGRLEFNGESYSAVILPPIDALDLQTARVLERFARAGGTLISTGALPSLAGTLPETPTLRSLLADLFQPGGLGRTTSIGQVVSVLRGCIPPDLALTTPNPDIFYTHRRLQGREVYFVVNNSSQPTSVRLSLRAPGPYQVFQPASGAILPAPDPLQVELGCFEGLFVVSSESML